MFLPPGMNFSFPTLLLGAPNEYFPFSLFSYGYSYSLPLSPILLSSTSYSSFSSEENAIQESKIE